MLDSFNISLIVNGTISDAAALNALQKYGKTIYLKKGERINSMADPAEQDFFYVYIYVHGESRKRFKRVFRFDKEYKSEKV